MEFLDPKLDEYVVAHTEPESELLYELNRDTNMNVLQPRMLSGHFQGRVLSLLSHMIQPKTILEIGTYTGYSALCLAEGMQSNGTLHTIDINEELETRIRSYFDRSDYKDRIKLHTGNALDVIDSIEGEFDLVFIDADKHNYLNYYHKVIDRVSKGGYIIADNVLWSGKVLDDPSTLDDDTRTLVEYAKFTHEDARVQNVLLPIRDGLHVCRKL